LTPEIGNFREKDLVSYMKYHFGEYVDYQICNKKEEDVVVFDRRISIKHSSQMKDVSSGIKVCWTVHSSLQDQFIDTYTFNTDLLLVYVNVEQYDGQIRVYYMSKEKLNIEYSNKFKKLNGNSRGIEFDPTYFRYIRSDSEFSCRIRFSLNQTDYMDPIQKRLQKMTFF
jgi:hypothetical protein